ncbi:FAD/NAD(P)-binding protein [Streptococcus pseudoporcinus]|uniref:FAD/NAD(P)-binding protein n=1 Tax=Streptococcus pseudoporcinus TaxID=361101 RepID=UPI001E3E17B1|nr:FAD/NAD(P)-binding protein [Streptococcus pseudoporcinus]
MASALINSPIDDISFDYHNIWLTKKGEPTDQAYVARALYGQYLSERAENLLEKLPVTVIKDRVDDLHYFPQEKAMAAKHSG